ncbi:MAG: type II secretion system F family protein [Chlamydiota bacterium]|nr:type II secretion system F family protein [Chlamydiota bacterium]
MSVFEYTGYDELGKKRKGSLEAETLAQAHHLLESDRISPSNISLSKRTPYQRGSSLSEQRFLLNQMASLLEVGIPLDEVLQECARNVSNRRNRVMILGVRDDVIRGLPLLEAIEHHSGLFAPWMHSAIKVGEQSGQLSIVLRDLADEVSRRLDWRSRWQQTAFYPAVLLMASIFVMSFVFYWTLPLMRSLFQELGRPLPVLTRFLLDVSSILHEWWLLIVILVAIVGIWIIRTLKQGRFYPVLLRFSITQSILQMRIASEFSRFIGLYLKSGVTFLESLNSLAMVQENPWVKKQIISIYEALLDGNDFDSAFKDVKLFPSAFKRMLIGSQHAANLEEVCCEGTKLYDKEMEKIVSQIGTWLGPVLTLLIGIIIAILVLSIYLPLMAW